MNLRRAILPAAVFALCACVAGCQQMSIYREGQQLLAQGRIEESLAKFQEAMRIEPTNAEYRTAYIATRERALFNWLDQAEKARAAGRAAEADQLYLRVLALDPVNARARAGLEEATRDARHADLLKQAQAAWQKKDAEAALARLRVILGENPKHREAATLRRIIEEATARSPADTRLSAALKKPITIEFQNTLLRQVFEVISRTSGLNFVFDRDVRSDLRTTIFLRDTTIQDAVAMILLTNQLEQRVLDANSILIYPNTPAKAREYQPLTVRTFFLSNADVKTAANTLRTILKTRDLIIDEKQNMIVMRDTPEAVRLAERLLALQDLPEPEVMLEVEILEVTRSRLLNLGVQWPTQLSLTPLSTTGGATLTLADLKNLNSSTLGASIGPAVINLQKQDTDSNLLANPRIRSRNREKARILVGDRVPNITTTATSTGFIAQNVTYVEVGLKLEVEPTIYMDDEVAIKVALEVSNIVNQIQTTSGTIAYQIGTRTANSVLRLKDGENQVLAGLINDNDRKAADKVPGLGDIPILGRLFGNQADNRLKTEIVLSITPRIIRNIPRPTLEQAEFDSGTEASLKSRGLEGSTGPAFTPPVPVTPAAPPLPAGPGAAPTPPTPPAVPDAAQTPPLTPGAVSTSAATAAVGDSGVARPGSGQPTASDSATAPVATPVGVAAAPAGAITAAGTRFAWNGPQQAPVGSTFTIELTVQPDQPITSIPFAIGFDPKLVEITAVTEGDFMRQGGAASTFTSRVDAAAGRVFATDTRNSADGATLSGTLVTLTIRTLSATPRASIQLVANSPIGVDGRSVTAQPTPEYVLQIIR